MVWNRTRKILMVLAGGGLLLQGATSCQDSIISLATEIGGSIILQALLGGLAT